MNSMFSECSSLIILPDITKWDTSKVINISNLFSFCSSLVYFPNIDEWKTAKCIYMRDVFLDCINSVNYEDIFREIYGNTIYIKIENKSYLLGDYKSIIIIGKITGMFLAFEPNYIYQLIEDENLFEQRILEGLNAIKEHFNDPHFFDY